MWGQEVVTLSGLPACPGGINSPCSSHGTCDDGHLGNGTCSCDSGFGGVACELCRDGFYGAACEGEQRQQLPGAFDT